MSRRIVTAAMAGLVSCHACGLVSSFPASDESKYCPRCAAMLHLRKPDSITNSWAFLVTAYILYIPANLLPIMETTTLTGIRYDTIMSGIISLWNTGSLAIAIIVFVASIMVPLLKLLVLTFLLISVQCRSAWLPYQRTRLYRLLGVIGRWSMLDLFVAAILTTLVQFRLLATVKVGPAAVPFGAVVVFTMQAAIHFDPRLIWDPVQKESGQDERTS